MFVRRFGFDFLDRFGRRVRPLVFPGRVVVNNGVVPPIPLPTTHPIPFPGEARMSTVVAEAGAFFKFPFELQFDCGTAARGTLFVSVETADERGTMEVSHIRAQVQ